MILLLFGFPLMELLHAAKLGVELLDTPGDNHALALIPERIETCDTPVVPASACLPAQHCHDWNPGHSPPPIERRCAHRPRDRPA